MKKISILAAAIVALVVFSSCSSDKDGITLPQFSQITVSPEQDTYKVGDKITLSVTQLTENSSDIKAEKEWFLYPDGETQSERIIFATRNAETNEFKAAIILKRTGNVELSFWTQYDLPQYKYDGVTLYKTITVIE